MRIRRFTVLLGVVALLAGAGAALARDDEPAADWNQERVTKYAVELSDACMALKESVSKAPPNLDPAHQRAFYRAKDDVRMLTSASRGLSASLESGEGKDETLPRFMRIQLLRADAEENGRKALLSDDILAKVTPVGIALIKLAPYYR